jgi:hypothetical protein
MIRFLKRTKFALSYYGGISAFSVAVATTLPAAWKSQDIGRVGQTGDAGYSGTSFTVKGAGETIWHRVDGFHFVYRTMTGDGEISVRVTSIDHIEPKTLAGVMIRESLNAGAAHSAMTVTAADGLYNLYRPLKTGTSGSMRGSGNASAPYWVKLVRTGDTFKAYESPNGVAWTLLNTRVIKMAAAVYVGLAVTSHTFTRWAEATFANVVVKGLRDVPVPGPTPAPPTPTPDPTGAGKGIWISRDKIAQLPTSGAAWQAVLADANRNPGVANLSQMESSHDQYTLAAALACARLGETAICNKAKTGILSAIGTEFNGGRWLEIARNLTAYVIAADIVGLRADGKPNSDGSRIDAWIRKFLTVKLPRNTGSHEVISVSPFASGSNASAQEGAMYAALAAYSGDRVALDHAWDAFRRYACDAMAPDRENINISKGIKYGWAHDIDQPCAVNPAGTTKEVPAGLPGAGSIRRIDGAIINDMRRGGYFQWPPGYTQYPWVGLEGLVPAALILHRAGYPAFEIADRAVLRTLEYLWYLRRETGDSRWFDGVRADEIIHLVNVIYGKSWPMQAAVGAGRTVGYTDWTHP